MGGGGSATGQEVVGAPVVCQEKWVAEWLSWERDKLAFRGGFVTTFRASASLYLKFYVYFTYKSLLFLFYITILQNTQVSPSIIHIILFK